VANGDTSSDTVRGYRSRLAARVNWCADHTVDARTATVDDARRYREDRSPGAARRRPSVTSSTCRAAAVAQLRARLAEVDHRLRLPDG
jgi:hypothetical protein